MRMTPEDYFDSFVKENYDDYWANKGSIRLAFNAAVSASHMADHYYYYNKKYDLLKVKSFNRLRDFINFLSVETNDCFRDIWSISNAYKHLYATNIYVTITSPGAIERISFLDPKSEIKDLSSNLIESQNDEKIVYTRKDGTQIDFLPTLETVIKYWAKLINH